MYNTFISVVFGFCLGLIFIPLDETMFAAGPGPALLVAAVMVVVVMSLWWWYAIFFMRVCPAESAPMYLLDLICLTSVALAGRLWLNPDVWTIVAIISIVCLLIRFGLVIFATKCPHHGLTKALRLKPQVRSYPRSDGTERRVLRSDIHLLGFGAIMLLFCIVIIAAFAAGKGSFFSGGDERDTLSDPQYAFLATIILGAVYTLWVACAVPGASVPLQAGGSTMTTPTATQPWSRLIAAYESVVTRQALRIRVRQIRNGKAAFEQSLAKAQLPAHLRSHSQNRLHSSYDVEVQAFAMGLRFSDSNEKQLHASGKLTWFIHWFDDLFDGGPYQVPMQRFLHELHMSNGKVDGLSFLETPWGTILKRQDDGERTGDKEVIQFIRLVEDGIPRDGKIMFQRGLRRLALGGVLLNESCDDEFGKWLLTLHTDAFEKIYHCPKHSRVAEVLGDCDPRTIALTTKPIQECWDALEPDDPCTTALMNILLMLPALEHNVELECQYRELDEKWKDYARLEQCKNDVNNVATALSTGAINATQVIPESRIKQLKFVLSATALYLDGAVVLMIEDVIEAAESN